MNRSKHQYITSGSLNDPTRNYMNDGVENVQRPCGHGSSLIPICLQAISTDTSYGGYNSKGVANRCMNFGLRKQNFENPIGMKLFSPICPQIPFNAEKPNEFVQPLFHFVQGSQRWGYLEHIHTGLYWTQEDNNVVLRKFTGASNQMWRYFCLHQYFPEATDKYYANEKTIEFP